MADTDNKLVTLEEVMQAETELELIRIIVEEMRFMVERVEPISDKNKNRYIIMVEALEKQIPKKIAYQIGKNGMKHEKCPTCGSFCVFGRYCSECGQKLDWKTECER